MCAPGLRLTGCYCQVDELLEGRPLLLAGLRPQWRVDEIAVGVGCHVAEEVFLDSFRGEVIAFKVEEDVVAGGCGEEGQTMLGVEGCLSVRNRASPASRPTSLYTRLLPDAFQCLPATRGTAPERTPAPPTWQAFRCPVCAAP